MSFQRYSLEIRHDGLGKWRRVRGETRQEVEEKARAQFLAWEDAYRRKLERERRHERSVAVRKSKEYALELTASFEAARERLANILRDTLAIDDSIDWEALKNRATFDEPEPVPPPEPDLSPSRYYHPCAYRSSIGFFLGAALAPRPRIANAFA